MYWLYLLLALGCFAFALKTPSAALMTLCLLAALAFLLAITIFAVLFSLVGVTLRPASSQAHLFDLFEHAAVQMKRGQQQLA
mgnify:CR=1 FL=1